MTEEIEKHVRKEKFYLAGKASDGVTVLVTPSNGFSNDSPSDHSQENCHFAARRRRRIHPIFGLYSGESHSHDARWK